MSFSETSLIKKLSELNNTQQSVQTLSLWLIHHRKHSKLIVSIWLKELLNESKCERKVTFIYLANDILQNSRKKGNEYMNDFSTVLLEAIHNTALKADDKTKFTLERILNIWKDRKLYTDKMIEDLRNALHKPDQVKIDHTNNVDDNILRSPPINESTKPSNKKSSASEGTPSTDNDEIKIKKRRTNEQLTPKGGGGESHNQHHSQQQQQQQHKPGLKDEVSKELAMNPDIKPPDATELIGILQDLEKSASSDAFVREKIAELPQQISDINALKNLKDKNEALVLASKVRDALELLDDYNKRLQDELVSRKKTALLLAAFIKQQQKDLESDQQAIDEWKMKLKQVQNVKLELEIHIKNLPDLSTIEVAAESSPLPSPNDLFS